MGNMCLIHSATADGAWSSCTVDKCQSVTVNTCQAQTQSSFPLIPSICSRLVIHLSYYTILGTLNLLMPDTRYNLSFTMSPAAAQFLCSLARQGFSKQGGIFIQQTPNIFFLIWTYHLKADYCGLQVTFAFQQVYSGAYCGMCCMSRKTRGQQILEILRQPQ